MLTLRVLLVSLLALLMAPAAGAVPGDYHSGLGDEVAPLAATPDTVFFEAPWAAPHQPGCTTDLISTNFSSRGGVVPRLLVLHYTVSSNTAGWGDVNAIRNWFSQARAQSSSTYIIDFEGNCKLIVPETMKPWTQTVFNPYSISIEFIATGRESKEAWQKAPGLKKGAQVFAAAAKRWDIPIRYVNPEGCGVPVKGITDHNDLECNSHTDVRPNFPYGTFMALTKNAAAPPKPQCQFAARRSGVLFYKTGPANCGSTLETAKFTSMYRAVEDRVLRFTRDGKVISFKRQRVEG
jgi:N-acetyl-anhydromuramyl-L-alanine amidase AmpD